MSSEVFILSSVRDASAAFAIRQAVELAGVSRARVQDAVFGLEAGPDFPDLEAITRSAGLLCPWAGVLSGLRALSFGAASMLSDDSRLTAVVGVGGADSAAVILASPEAVGMLNLLPRARVAARSLAGPDLALQLAGLETSDAQVCKEGDSLVLLHTLLGELEQQELRWGLITSGSLALAIERV